ncbi:protein of unknown function [Xenorhabdus doucetiae]|uniref:Uncharacterized protein n=1 Tax=Xenorhabdus doucetiae TaxID=351671 RepID=A0A068QTT1_9GAMM|nr:protein of unknown function [Xenorhabdus doucetiae]
MTCHYIYYYTYHNYSSPNLLQLFIIMNKGVFKLNTDLILINSLLLSVIFY